MKRVLIASLVIGLLIGAFALSSNGPKATNHDLLVEVEGRNPWTHLRLNDAPDKFQFVVVSDRTGGHRARVFSQAVEQINLLQPTFVVCVGDLINGYSKDNKVLSAQWKEFQTYTSRLQMPFFYVPGNHDVANSTQAEGWKDRFGKAYYHFIYKDVLFLALNTDDPHEEKEGRISKEQVEYFQKVLADNPKVRWTFVLLHKPIWTQANLDKTGWLDIEKALLGRQYTVFCGHVHRYQKFVRQGMNYYQLATTGGGSRLRGLRYGEFDHVAWVTVKKDADPVVANLMLDGIYPENLKKTVTDEEGLPILNRKPVQPVQGTVMLDGVPAVNVQLIFWRADPPAKDAKPDKDGKVPPKIVRVSDVWVEADGSYHASTYVANDGLEIGEYKVTATLREPHFEPSGTLGKNLLPARYATYPATELSATVKAGSNVIDFRLSSK